MNEEFSLMPNVSANLLLTTYVHPATLFCRGYSISPINTVTFKVGKLPVGRLSKVVKFTVVF